MTGTSIETTLELWASSLRDVKRRMRSLFAQERTAGSAGFFIDGLLSEERRKTGWMRAEAAGDPGPWRQQALLGRDQWEADALRDMVRDYVVEHLADEARWRMTYINAHGLRMRWLMQHDAATQSRSILVAANKGRAVRLRDCARRH